MVIQCRIFIVVSISKYKLLVYDFYVVVSVFFPLNVCFMIQLNFVGARVPSLDSRRILKRDFVNEPGL